MVAEPLPVPQPTTVALPLNVPDVPSITPHPTMDCAQPEIRPEDVTGKPKGGRYTVPEPLTVPQP